MGIAYLSHISGGTILKKNACATNNPKFVKRDSHVHSYKILRLINVIYMKDISCVIQFIMIKKLTDFYLSTS